jgi:serine/threonine protein kinase
MSTGVQPPANPDPLRETSRYTKVADLSHGSFGFVQLARNTETQELVAIKFIERGDRVNRCASSSNSSCMSSAGMSSQSCGWKGV